MMRPNRLSIMVVALLLAGIASRIFFSFEVYLGTSVGTSVYVGILVAEVMLLGIWGGVGASPADKRVRGVVAGLVWLWTQTTFPLWGGDAFFALSLTILALSFPVFAIITWISWFRLGNFRLRRFDRGSVLIDDNRLQFSIRHLLIATAGVAMLLALVQVIAIVDLVLPDSSRVVLIQLVVGLGSPPIAVAALWACLGFGRVVPRLTAVVGIAASTLALPLAYPGLESSILGLFAMSLAIGATIVIAFLLVARHAGFRLVPLGAWGNAQD